MTVNRPVSTHEWLKHQLKVSGISQSQISRRSISLATLFRCGLPPVKKFRSSTSCQLLDFLVQINSTLEILLFKKCAPTKIFGSLMKRLDCWALLLLTNIDLSNSLERLVQIRA